jgi:hypothetical protein
MQDAGAVATGSATVHIGNLLIHIVLQRSSDSRDPEFAALPRWTDASFPPAVRFHLLLYPEIETDEVQVNQFLLSQVTGRG